MTVLCFSIINVFLLLNLCGVGVDASFVPRGNLILSHFAKNGDRSIIVISISPPCQSVKLFIMIVDPKHFQMNQQELTRTFMVILN